MKWPFDLFQFFRNKVSVRLNALEPSKRAQSTASIIEDSLKGETPKASLKYLFELENRIYKLQSKVGKLYDQGLHPKHRLTRYHDFFVEHIRPGDRILDVGSGLGVLAYDMVSRVPDVQVLGIELDRERVAHAKKNYVHPHLEFKQDDILRQLPERPFDVVTMSNILEHLDERVLFLQQLRNSFHLARLIIRVPQYNRDWRVPLKDEVGVDSRLNRGHFIEYTQEDLINELKQSGFQPTEMRFAWGEIWTVAEPIACDLKPKITV